MAGSSFSVFGNKMQIVVVGIGCINLTNTDVCEHGFSKLCLSKR